MLFGVYSSPVLFLRRLVVFIAIACAVIFAVSSLRWPLVGDASLMHYVVFLAERGLTPYREIADINLPGTYAAGWLAMHLFGDGPLAWRLYDLVLGLTAAIAMAVIAWPYDRLAGIFAGALFVLIHGRDGMAELGQRDLLMTVLLLWAVALTLCALRRRRLFFIPLAGALAGFAFTIKPPAVLFWIATLGFVALLQKPRKKSPILPSGGSAELQSLGENSANHPSKRQRRDLYQPGAQPQVSARPETQRAESPLYRLLLLTHTPQFRAFLPAPADALHSENPLKPSQLLHNGIWPLLIVPAIALAFIIHGHALRPFWFITTRLIPLHNSLLRFPNSYFLLHLLPATLIPISLLCLLALFMRKRAGMDIFNETEVLLALNALCGLLSFYVQRKALPYHRYPADAFLVLLISLIFFRSLKDAKASKALRISGATGLLFAALILAPQSLLRTFRVKSNPNGFSKLLQEDLSHLGGASLDRNVQCIDFTAGCVTTLYRMKIEQSTGFLYDCYALQQDTNPVVRQYREEFWNALVGRKPRVIVLTNQDCGHDDSFDKLSRWPQLDSFIEHRYSLYKQVTPPDKVRWTGKAEPPYSYRIYVLRS